MGPYQTFVFDSYQLDVEAGRIDLNYSLDEEIRFTETVQLPAGPPVAMTPEVDRALFALHLAGGVSYFKSCLPGALEIRSGSLSASQAGFWSMVYERGLGEFFYQNQIDFRGLIKFPHVREADTLGAASPHVAAQIDAPPHFLVPVGGGKDSLVTIELLRAVGAQCTLFRSGAHPLISAVVEASGLPLLTVERKLSPELFRLNAAGALNGHVPITAYLSFLTVVLALLYGFQFVAFSNERSASEGNTEHFGTEVNHQWSKSLEFERAFASYVREAITPRVMYASLLRPLSELHIAKLFTRFPQYFDRATSCNNNWRIARVAPVEPEAGMRGSANSRWCGTCPKCAFAFALFAAFLPRDVVVRMFGKDLFGDPELLPMYRMLLGVEGIKPFECVGTPDETRLAFHLAAARGYDPRTPAIALFNAEVAPLLSSPEEKLHELMQPVSEHLIPEWLLRRLEQAWKVEP